MWQSLAKMWPHLCWHAPAPWQSGNCTSCSHSRASRETCREIGKSQLINASAGDDKTDDGNPREETNNKLHRKHAHCGETQPRVERVEMLLAQCVVRIQDGEETERNAGNRDAMEEHVNQFHIDVLQAAAQSIE